MTARVESIADGIVASPIARDWEYSPSPDGVLDFKVDGRWFRILILEEAQDIEYVQVVRTTDEEPMDFDLSLTATESAEIAKAQALADATDADYLTEALSGEELLEALDEDRLGPAQAAEFEQQYDEGGEG